jgi:hypothetical protein
MRGWRPSGEGASLARMAALGLPVPPGFHVTTTAYRRFVEANNLRALIAETMASAQPDDPASLERASPAVRQLFLSGAVPDAISAAIHTGYADLGAAELTGAGAGGSRALIRHRRRRARALVRRPVRQLPQRSRRVGAVSGGATLLGLLVDRACDQLPAPQRGRRARGRDGCRGAAYGPVRGIWRALHCQPDDRRSRRTGDQRELRARRGRG